MKYLVLGFFLLTAGAAHANDCGEFQPKWVACSVDADCVLTEGICSRAAVNKNFVSEPSQHFRCSGVTVDCAPDPNAGNEAKAVCSSGKCEVSYTHQPFMIPNEPPWSGGLRKPKASRKAKVSGKPKSTPAK